MIRFLLVLLTSLLLAAPARAQGTSPGLMPVDTTLCNITAVPALGIPCFSLISPQTSNWFASDSPPANFITFGDRLFGGDAINYPNNGSCGTGDWFTIFEATTSNGACAYIGTFESVIESKTNNANAGAGLLVAGQSAHMSSATNGAFGLAAFGLENKTGAGSRNGGATWAIYGECDKTQNNGGNCYGLELDVMTEVNVANQPDPFTQGNLIGNQIACGSGLSSPTNFHCAAAIQIVANSQPYNVGINFINGGVANGGPSSTTVAIAFPTTYQLAWFSAAATAQAGITADSAGYLDLTLANGIKVNGTNSVSCTAGSVNGATLTITDGIVTHC